MVSLAHADCKNSSNFAPDKIAFACFSASISSSRNHSFDAVLRYSLTTVPTPTSQPLWPPWFQPDRFLLLLSIHSCSLFPCSSPQWKRLSPSQSLHKPSGHLLLSGLPLPPLPSHR